MLNYRCYVRFTESRKGLCFFYPLPVPQKRKKIKENINTRVVLPPGLLLRALAASGLPCLLSSETVLVGPTCTSWHGDSSSLKHLKICGTRGGETGERYIGFFLENVTFFPNVDPAKKLFKGETRVSIWKCCCNSVWNASLG